jgi:molybdopterin molybdotransferase
MPPDADTVVKQEDVTVEDGAVIVTRAPLRGAHVRTVGDDVPDGALTLEPGVEIGPGEVGLLAALGIAFVQVVGRPRVGILVTGDELCEIDEPPGPGQIVSSSSYMLAAQVAAAGGVPVPLGIARDDVADIAARARRGTRTDLLLTTGGVSVGDYDLVRSVLDGLGWKLDFWKVRMRPGKPVAFGLLGDVPVLGLPGNPASSMVCFEVFARPAIRAMAGHPRPYRTVAVGRLVSAVRKEDHRTHFVRCGASDQRGELFLRPLLKQGSGALSSMIGVAALAIVDGPPQEIPAGGQVPAMILDRFYADRSQPGWW